MIDRPTNVKIPLPGSPVRGSKTGQPIMVLFDLLGRRWAMGIIWNLHQNNCTFRALQNQCESISPTVLNTRLKELRAAHLVTHSKEGYALTQQGQDLFNLLSPLGSWSHDWVKLLT